MIQDGFIKNRINGRIYYIVKGAKEHGNQNYFIEEKFIHFKRKQNR